MPANDTRPDAIAARHAFACTVAREAGALALGFYTDRARLKVETKADPMDVVSRADRAVEDLIRDRLAAAFPDDAILGEEGGATAGVSGFGWVIDPIDGTMPFLSGLPHWCIALAVTQGVETVAAATFTPVTGRLWEASRGGGARCDGVALAVDPSQGLTGRMTAIGASHRTDAGHLTAVIGGVMAAGGVFYRSGSGALMLAQVAEGALAGYYEPHMHPWDALGGLLMVAEAGGRTEPFPQTGGRVLAGAPAAFAAMQEIVAAAA